MERSSVLRSVVYCVMCLSVLLWWTPASAAKKDKDSKKRVRSTLVPATFQPRARKVDEPSKKSEKPDPKDAKKGKAAAKTSDKMAEKQADKKSMAKASSKGKKPMKKGKKGKKRRKSKSKSNIVRVVGAYRPVDLRKAGPAPQALSAPSSQNGLDLYLSLETPGAISAGQDFDVYRRVAAPTLRRTMMTLKVGEVRIVGIEGQLAVARVIMSEVNLAHPYLKVPGVLIGDFIVPTRPIVREKDKPRRRKKPVEVAEEARGEGEETKKKKREVVDDHDFTSGRRQAPKHYDEDPDNYKYWDTRSNSPANGAYWDEGDIEFK